jgi:hypothetical protein
MPRSILPVLRLFGLVMLILALTSSLVASPTAHVQAQDGSAGVPTFNEFFTWREAPMSIGYPAGWQVGVYEVHPVLASTPSALTLAVEGQAPDAPALTFLYYQQTSAARLTEFVDILIPGVETTTVAPEIVFPTLSGIDLTRINVDPLRAEFQMVINPDDSVVYSFEPDYDERVDKEGDEQTVLMIAFEPPANRRPHMILAAAPTETWEAFRPTLDAMLASTQFYTEAAELDLLGAQVSFDYPSSWTSASTGQVFIAAPSQDEADAVLNGQLQGASAFLRAQVLAPEGIGIDAASPTASVEILQAFGGEAVTGIQNFDWAEDVPAASALFEFEGLQLLLIAAVDGETAMLMAAGAAPGRWTDYQEILLGGLNLTSFNENPPPLNLNELILSGNGNIFGTEINNP